MSNYRIEQHDLHGTGPRDCKVYEMPCVKVPMRHYAGPDQPDEERPTPDFWASVTDVPCPVDGCDQMIAWCEAGYTAGYRVCMRRIDAEHFDHDSIRHRFLAGGDAEHPTLILDEG